MDGDEQEIRALIERWAAAVHAGDLDGVLADHADDIVMFDVPPPARRRPRHRRLPRRPGRRSSSGRRRARRSRSSSLDVTAGADVAFAHALLRCGTPESSRATRSSRLRLTLGCASRTAGGWSPTSTTRSPTRRE